MSRLRLLAENSVQFGHQTWRWCPKMAPFIWGEKNGIHLIDVSKTAQQIDKASQFLEEVAASGKQILWVGTKRAAQPVIAKAAHDLGSPYVTTRWIGGTLSNYSQVRKSIAKLMHYEDILAKSEEYSYTKKEYSNFKKMVDRLQDAVGGIRDLAWPIGALVVVDVKKERVAIKEAQTMGIPVVALVDTNADPSGIDYVIPTNDDVARAIKVVIDPLVESVANGKARAEEAAALKKSAAAAEIAEAKKEKEAAATEKTAKESSEEKSPRAKKAATKEAEKAPKAKASVKKEKEVHPEEDDEKGVEHTAGAEEA